MSNKGFFHNLASLFSGRTDYQEVSPGDSCRLRNTGVRVLYPGAPICVRMIKEGFELHIYHEHFLDESAGTAIPCYQLFDPGRRKTGISGFIRLCKPGDSFILGQQNRSQPVACQLPDNLEMRILSITHDGDALVFRKLVRDTEIEISQVPEEKWIQGITERRRNKLRHISEIFGGAIERLPPPEALATLRAVNQIMQEEAYRPLDDRGQPGGVLRLPPELTPIIVGDLHAQVDNLLTLLSHNRFLEALEAGEAALVILGDAVHSELEDQLSDMDDSLLMMDLILRLKLRFPEQLFYIRGNHDSFSTTQSKFGVAQCLIWEHALHQSRGDSYLKEMRQFYDRLPYVVISDDFVASHAAPIKTHFDMDMLVNIYRNTGLIGQLTRNRIRRRTAPAGYTKADVRHFRRILGLSDHTPFLVSHSPLDRDNPYWLEAGGIKNHHIVFSANLASIGVFTRIGGHMVPLSYYAEKVLPLVDE